MFNLAARLKPAVHLLLHDRSWRNPSQPIMGGPFAMVLPMGTLEGSKHKPWTWILGAPLVTLKEAGVEFDPNVRGLKAIQGDADSGSALEVISCPYVALN